MAPLCGAEVIDAFDRDPAAIQAIATELLAYVRGIVHQHRADPQTLSPAIGFAGVVSFAAWMTPDGRVHPYATGSVRDLAVLQFERLLDLVGLQNVQACGADACPHLFVKTYRREFCSERCQKRMYKRRQREAARAQEARRRARRQRIRQHA